VRRLLPNPGPTTVIEQLDSLDLHSLAPAERPYVVTNFALTLDGKATVDGRAGPIGSRTDTEMLMELRACVDAVMIGAGTMRVERYGRMVPSAERRERRERRGLAQDPLAVVVSATLDLPWDAGLFTDGSGPVLIFTSSEREVPETASPLRVVRDRDRVDLAAALGHLRREHGVLALLCEGGPRLHGELLEAGLVDELFVTQAPKVAGGIGPGLVEGAGERVRELELAWLLEEDGELFARYRCGARRENLPAGAGSRRAPRRSARPGAASEG
jgi:riboflavin-specific deaminase-like protein